MPKVGDKDFAYTEEGVTKAKEYAKETNQEMEMYYAGGIVNAPDRVQSYKGGGEIKVGDVTIGYEEGGEVKSVDTDRPTGGEVYKRAKASKGEKKVQMEREKNWKDYQSGGIFDEDGK